LFAPNAIEDKVQKKVGDLKEALGDLKDAAKD